MTSRFVSKTYCPVPAFGRIDFRFYLPEIKIAELPQWACAAHAELHALSGNLTPLASAWIIGSNRAGHYLLCSIPARAFNSEKEVINAGFKAGRCE